jgi:RNA polymerase sigma-70 factor (ECF subfamily)
MNTSTGNSLEHSMPAAASIPAISEKEAMAGLIEQIARRQDRSAFIQLYKHFAPRVKSFLIGKGLNSATADDVLQEVMLAIWQKSHLYNPAKAAVSTWIFTIARNKYVDRLRREQRHQCESDEPDLRAGDTMASTDEVLQQENTNAVHEALTRLRPEQQEVVVLSFIKGLAHSEIAQHLSLPLGTVKSRIRLALRHLRNDLGEFQQLNVECFDA